MFRIGLIGTENSHALAFAKYFNLPNEDGKYNEEDVRVTAILGADSAADEKIVEILQPVVNAVNKDFEVIVK